MTSRVRGVIHNGNINQYGQGELGDIGRCESRGNHQQKEGGQKEKRSKTGP